MTSITVEDTKAGKSVTALRTGSWLMGIAAAGFIGYAVIFFVRNFTDSFLELGIGSNEVNVGKDAIQAFSPSLFDYVSHLHIAVSGFIAATGLAVLFLVIYGVRRGQLWAWVGAVGSPRSLPEQLRYPRPPGADLPRGGHLGCRSFHRAAGDHGSTPRLMPSAGG